MRSSACLFVASTFGISSAKLNLLMIISDQHRWDALGAAGNEIIQTPVLDKLAAEGVRFANAYTVCPVCCPSRTSMLAGRTPEQTQVRGNGDIDTAPRAMTYDRVLLANGWRGQYTGKYHSPYNYTRDASGKTYYSKDVQWLNGKGPVNAPAGVLSLSSAYRAVLDAHEPLQQLQLGQLLDAMYQRPYWADVADLRYAAASNETLLALSNKLIGEGKANKVPTTDQQHVNGRLALQPNHSYSALTLADAMTALDELKDAPFTLTASFESPHPPFVIPAPFYGAYPNGSIPDPPTVEDAMTASPYHHPHSPSGNEDQVRQQTSNYYGMIAQNDRMVGELLGRLDELNLAAKTLVIYVADHGEMLGDHHMQSKMVFYEGSVHVPFIMRLPTVIPAGAVVDAPVSTMSLFGTIVDYLGLPSTTAPCTSPSLRPLIEGTTANATQVIFSFWDTDSAPGFMAFDGRFKLMIGRLAKAGSAACNADLLVPFGGAAESYYYLPKPCGLGADEQGFDAPGVDALYDLRYDPREVINLLRSPYVQKPLSALHPGENDTIVPFERARRLQKALVAWLNETDSEYASAVAVREMNTSHINQVPVLARGGNDASAPVMPARIAWKVGLANTFTVPAETFLDVDGDALHFNGTLDRHALPGWLQVHPNTGIVHGKPPSKGTYLLRVMASDHKTAGSAFIEYSLDVSVAAV